MKQLVWALNASVLCVAAVAEAGSAVDKPAFTATPAELLAAAKAAPAGDWPITILREEHDVSFDERGRETHRWRMVFVIRNQAGGDDWGTLGAPWSPFYQNKPIVRARVTQPDGSASMLDASLVSDAPVVEKSSSVFSDQRTLHAPLPRMQIGAVVEEEVVTSDREPILATFGESMVWPGNYVPVESFRATFSAPATSKARIVARGLDPKARPKHDVKGGRETWAYDLGALAATGEREVSVPGDVVVDPRIGITTAPSWGALAKEYRKVIERRIAEGTFALPAALPRTTTLATINAITAWLHAQVRYTGIEFGEASNVPWPPAETVKRGFGDCKDKATLLVALLRQAGVRADLAILYDGPGRDVDVDLPGMGVFDHAIVRARMGATDVWIDATEDMVAPGRLPIRDQGRRALVISEDSTALVVTPRFADNVIREVRTFGASEDGVSAVTEVSTVSGAFAPDYRQWFGSARAEDLRKSLTTYSSDTLKADAFTSYAFAARPELSEPVELTIKATGSQRVFTDRDHIDIWLFPSDALEKVPGFLTKAADPSEKPRVHDYEWTTPHVFEIENRVVLPPGFSPPAVEPGQTRKLGTATFSEHRSIQDNTLVITFRFESGKQRLTTTELAALRTALRPLSEERSHIVVSHRAWAASAKGNVQEAIAECERLIKLHPKEARHHSELATMYLNAGAGAAARREAAKAVQLEPSIADPYVVQGWILRHDTIGREYGFDFDHAGAVTAFTKARALGPKHVGAAVELARTLERDAQGRSVSARKELLAAAAAWGEVVKISQEDEHLISHARALLRADKPAEAEAAARRAATSDVRDALVVAAATAGVPAAGINAATSMRTGVGRTELLQKAGSELFLARNYPGLTALMQEAGTFQSGSTEAAMFQRLARHDEKFEVGRDPKLVVADLFLSVMDIKHRATTLLADDEGALSRGWGKYAAQMAVIRALPSAALRDLVQSGLATKVEGPANGPWRVDAEFFGKKFVAYVALVGKEAKLIGLPEATLGVGKYAFQRVEAGDRVAARQLLDWVHDDVARTQPTARILKLWAGNARTDDKALAVAAAANAFGTAGDRAVPILTKCESVPEARSMCDAALALEHSKAKRWKELEAHAIAWHGREPAETFPLTFQIQALLMLRRYDEADAVALAMAKDPNDYSVLVKRAEIGAARRDVPEAARRYEILVKHASVKAVDKNNYAWWMLGEKRDLKAALELAQASLRDTSTPSTLNTIAAIEAELGDVGMAHSYTMKSIEGRQGAIPDASDWYVFGRMYEQLGLRADAIAAYKRIKTGRADALSSDAFAAERLKVLGVP